ncbi:MAG: NUDIX domain-containing protein [Gammaproteobacteria bacterium]|nr:NUDIX domain-containing protein [Gammaproteobacteria bacterium]
MTKRFTNKDITITQDQVLYQGFMQLRKLTFSHALYAGGVQSKVQREMLFRGKAVGVLLFDPQLDEFVLVEQVRIGAMDDPESPWLLEVVAGMVEEGESESEVAVREAYEEAGAQVQRLIPIQDYWVSPGGTNEQVSLYLGLVNAQTVSDFAGLENEHEDIKVMRLKKSETLKMLRAGLINNAMALIALQWFFLNESELDLSSP